MDKTDLLGEMRIILEFVGKSVRPLKSSSMHRHIGWELVYNEKGSGKMRLRDQEIQFKEGSITLYPPGMVHQKVSEGFLKTILLFSPAVD